MPQFFVPRKNIRGLFFTFEESESYHLARVLRKKKGEIVQIFDGEGTVLAAKIIDCSDDRNVKGEILTDQRTVSPTSKPSGQSLAIYPAILKVVRFEWMLEKVTELGVNSIHPVFTQRTLVQIRSQQIDSKLKRWEKILLVSAKQCGRIELPKISAPIHFQQAIRNTNKNDLNLILWEGEEKNSLSYEWRKFKEKERVSNTSKEPARILPTINLFIGPEGGFTIEEATAAKIAGIVPVRLGENILRAETATIAAVSQILLGLTDL